MQSGMTIGPDGQPLLKAFGPFYSPIQRFVEYEFALFVGIGVGTNQISAPLQSIAHHLWVSGLAATFPTQAYFIWANEIDSYRCRGLCAVDD